MSELISFITGTIFGAVVIPYMYGQYRKWKLRKTVWFGSDSDDK